MRDASLRAIRLLSEPKNFMHNPFANPYTPGQWLLSSVCWTVVCVGGWLAFNYTQGFLLQELGVPTGLDFVLAFVSFFLAQVMLWRHAVRGFKPEAHTPLKLKVFALLWRVGVFVFQLLWLGVGLLLLEFRLIDGGP
jgi:hypothetical protein